MTGWGEAQALEHGALAVDRFELPRVERIALLRPDLVLAAPSARAIERLEALRADTPLTLGDEEARAKRATSPLRVFDVKSERVQALLMPERGVSYHGDHRWLFIVAGEILLVARIASSGRSDLSGAAWKQMLEHWLLRSPPAPLLGRVLFAGAFAAAVWVATRKPA